MFGSFPTLPFTEGSSARQQTGDCPKKKSSDPECATLQAQLSSFVGWQASDIIWSNYLWILYLKLQIGSIFPLLSLMLVNKHVRCLDHRGLLLQCHTLIPGHSSL